MDIFISKFQQILIPLIIFIILFVFDLILGISKGIKYKRFSSSKLRNSIPKFLSYVFTIIACMLIDVLATYSTSITFFDNYSPIALTSAILISLIEFCSMLENAYILGAKLPKFLINIISLINGEISAEERTERAEQKKNKK